MYLRAIGCQRRELIALNVRAAGIKQILFVIGHDDIKLCQLRLKGCMAEQGRNPLTGGDAVQDGLPEAVKRKDGDRAKTNRLAICQY